MPNSPAVLTEDLISTHFITEYILSPDPFAGTGIEELLNEQGKTCVRLPCDIPLHTHAEWHSHTYWRLTLVMPGDPLALLEMIWRLAEVIRFCSRPPRILILCPVAADWLMRTLSVLACPKDRMTLLTVLPCRTDCAVLTAALAGLPIASAAQGESLAPPFPVLTPVEYRVVSDWLAGHSARASALRAGGSVKTIYIHRYHGRCKLGCVFPALLPRVRGAESPSCS